MGTLRAANPPTDERIHGLSSGMSSLLVIQVILVAFLFDVVKAFDRVTRDDIFQSMMQQPELRGFTMFVQELHNGTVYCIYGCRKSFNMWTAATRSTSTYTY